MSTVTELISYCGIDNPVGAVLLTGEWGCGKTYLIEHQFAEETKDFLVIVRVSLFGMASIEELHTTVKKKWLFSRNKILDKVSWFEKARGFIDKAKDAIPDKTAKSLAGGLLSINYLDFITVSNKIGDKKVVLVFDDIERTKLSPTEILGAINDYCENQHFNVIIVADATKIKKQKRFDEIKEKVIQRTIHLEPDYSEIVKSIISEVSNKGYKDFLNQHCESLTAIFAGRDLQGKSLNTKSKEFLEQHPAITRGRRNADDVEEEKRELINRRPHNIRSLKAVLQDFESIYIMLEQNRASDTHKWLLSYMAFYMAARANLIKRHKDYGMLFGNHDLEMLYPGFYDPRYMPDCLSRWIMEGKWCEEELKETIEIAYSHGETGPASLVVKMRVDYLSEEDAITGMREVLPKAYGGKLSLNEYIVLIINSKVSRDYGLNIEEINWDKIRDGIAERVRRNKADGNKRETFRQMISEKQGFSEDEWGTYLIIAEELDNSRQILRQNREEYIELFNDDPEKAIIKCNSRRYNSFDLEMVDATYQGYVKATNEVKGKFPSFFENVWANYCNSFDIDDEAAKKIARNFDLLKSKLESLLEEYSEYPFKLWFTRAFIDVLSKLIKKSKKESEEEEVETGEIL